jgi:ribosomal protein L37E
MGTVPEERVVNVRHDGRFHRIIDARTEAGGTLRGIECKRCQQVSFNPNDVLNGYCGFCHVHLRDLEQAADLKSTKGIETHLTAPIHCSRCRVKMELATCTEQGHTTPPTEGDAMVCAHCGQVNVYTADGSLRAVTEDDWTHWSPETRAMTQRAAAWFTWKNRDRRELN